jgi:hypothetical protein
MLCKTENLLTTFYLLDKNPLDKFPKEKIQTLSLQEDLGKGKKKKQDSEKIEGKFSIITTRYYTFHLILLALCRKSNVVS